MIVVTGAAGFIGSCMVEKLNQQGFFELILVDDFSQERKKANYDNKKFKDLVDRNDFPVWLNDNHKLVEFVYHIGARTDTTEFDVAIFDELNLNYTKSLWEICSKNSIPFVYASSAATYGLGELGYKDDHALPFELKPLNPYGESKNDFDIWALKQEKHPYFWAGFKFFNVYGPNEYHKGRMASVIWHAYNQITSTGAVKLFQSHNPNYQNGEQLRDFIYVKDVVEVLFFMLNNRKVENSGLYNLGTGKARSFNDLAQSTFGAVKLEPAISYVPTPKDIRDKYQYFTEAEMSKLKSIGYTNEFTSLEKGVEDYVTNYLIEGSYY
jgi:ADP-L-glycero-D-manno-heptose 6-epimerase